MQTANKLENSLTYVANIEEDPFKYLFDKLEKVFSERDCDIFYKVFGINGVEQMKGFEVANEYGVSAGLISQKISKMIKWIREDKDLFERLGELL
jgi:DNA-directed RNA polymerase specialized sigma subunit